MSKNTDVNIAQKFVAWAKLKLRIHHYDKKLFFKEREIWWTSLGMNVGYEQNGKNETFERPVLILKKFNHDICWVLPMTSQEKEGKYYYKINYGDKISYLILSQLRVVSCKRLLRKLGTLDEESYREVKKRIKSFL